LETLVADLGTYQVLSRWRRYILQSIIDVTR